MKTISLGLLLLVATIGMASQSHASETAERRRARGLIASAIRGVGGDAANMALQGFVSAAKSLGWLNSDSVGLYCTVASGGASVTGRVLYCIETESDRMLAIAGLEVGASEELGLYVGVASASWFAPEPGTFNPVMCETLSGAYYLGIGGMYCGIANPLFVGGLVIGAGASGGAMAGTQVRVL